MKLKIAAKVDNADKEYYESRDQAAAREQGHVEFIGEINETRSPQLEEPVALTTCSGIPGTD